MGSTRRCSLPGVVSVAIVFLGATATGSFAQSFKTLLSFDGADGAQPIGLVQGIDGNLYGTTAGGGADSSCSDGCGTIFKMTGTGSLTTLHSFDVTDRPARKLDLFT